MRSQVGETHVGWSGILKNGQRLISEKSNEERIDGVRPFVQTLFIPADESFAHSDQGAALFFYARMG